MKYKIEIWMNHRLIDEFESNDPEEIIKWFDKDYRDQYDYGYCTYYLYKDGEEMSTQDEINFMNNKQGEQAAVKKNVFEELDTVEQKAAIDKFRKALDSKFDPRTRTVSRNGYIDEESFHAAYDTDLEKLGLLDRLFNKTTGELQNRGTYGIIKDIDKTVYPNLAKDLGNFWGAQFKDGLHTQKAKKIADDAAAEYRAWEQEQEEKRKAAEAEAAVKLSEHNKKVQEIVNSLYNRPELRELLDKLKAAGITQDPKITVKSSVGYQSNYKPHKDTKGYIDRYTIEGIDNHVRYKNTPDSFVSTEAPIDYTTYTEEIYKGLLDLKTVVNQAINRNSRDQILKQLTGKDAEYFGNNAEVILQDNSKKLYALILLPEPYSLSGDHKTIGERLYLVDLKTREDVDPSSLNNPEVVAISFEERFEHDTNSIYGWVGVDETICLTSKAPKEVYDYFKLKYTGNPEDIEDSSTNNFLTDVDINAKTNKEVKGVVYPVVVERDKTYYND